MNTEVNHIAFFDLDRTILGMNSGYALGMSAYKMGLMKRSHVVKAILLLIMYRLRLRSAEKMITGMGKWLGGLSEQTVIAMAEKSVNDYLLNSVYDGFREELKVHNSRNAHTAFLTSAITEICVPLASEFGIKTIISTDMARREGIYTGNPENRYCYGKEKARKLEEFCKKNGIPVTSAYYYADSISDLSALELVGNPVCVNPDRKLRRIAVKKGWQIVTWNK